MVSETVLAWKRLLPRRFNLSRERIFSLQILKKSPVLDMDWRLTMPL